MTDQDHIGRLDGNGGAGPNGDADMSLHQRRRMMSGMPWGMGLLGLLVIVLLILGVAALVKYLFRG